MYLPRPSSIPKLVFPGLYPQLREGAVTKRFHLDSLQDAHPKYFPTLNAYYLEVGVSENTLCFLTLKNPYIYTHTHTHTHTHTECKMPFDF